MKPTVYLETTIVSYLTARLSNDVVRQAQQEVTRQWWNDRRHEFALYTSQFVLDEAAAGDPAAAAERLVMLDHADLLTITPETEPLAEQLLRDGALPLKAKVDALHVAVATVNGMEYLITWNCRHLANAVLWHRIDRSCRLAGFQPPTICTPYELLGDEP